MPAHHVAWIKENHWDPTTIITTTLRLDTESKKLTVDSDNWIFDNKPFLVKFSTSFPEEHLGRYLKDKYAGTTWTAVGGFDKPFVYFKDGQWYTRQHNKVLAGLFGVDYIECFFLDPILHLKQSHLAKNALKKIKQRDESIATKLFHNNMNTNFKDSALEYLAWSTMIGRHKELTHGVSHEQKMSNKNATYQTSKILANIDNATLDPYLKYQLENKNPVALDYINGLYNLKSETLFVDYLNDNHLMNKDHLLSTKIIWSKSYNLGP
jgi:hypothetical protein